MTAQAREESGSLKKNEKKWGKEVMDAGFTIFPSIILEKQHALGLDALDVNIILQLAKHWWEAEDLPRPSKDSLATRIGVNPRTVQRHVARLEKDGFIRRIAKKNRHGGNDPNEYDLTGLIKQAEPFAIEALTERKQRDEEKKAKLRRKKPRLHVVPGSGT